MLLVLSHQSPIREAKQWKRPQVPKFRLKVPSEHKFPTGMEEPSILNARISSEFRINTNHSYDDEHGSSLCLCTLFHGLSNVAPAHGLAHSASASLLHNEEDRFKIRISASPLWIFWDPMAIRSQRSQFILYLRH